MKYKMVNINNKKLPLMVSNDLTTLWQELDNYKRFAPVIVDENNDVVAGHKSAWNWAKLKGFKV